MTDYSDESESIGDVVKIIPLKRGKRVSNYKFYPFIITGAKRSGYFIVSEFSENRFQDDINPFRAVTFCTV
jgi:hypothetical protein